MVENEDKQIITRFAPSPTGALHIGSARTALFNYLFTRQNGGKMILRIEDTDKMRSEKKYEEDILEGLKWLGIEWDGEVYKQSERGDIYKKYLQKLIDEDKAYVSDETEKHSEVRPLSPLGGSTSKSERRDSVIRFRNPGGKIAFKDLIRGEIEFEVDELGDFVIAKDMETPLYHLAVVVDDFEMGITHVVRGEDGISNTPRQILIQGAIKAPRPIYAHIPLILGSDRSKMSKRHGSTSIKEYRDLGYLSEAFVNFLAFLGWNPGDEREIFSMEELVKEFSLEKVKKGGAMFNIGRLDWINSEYIKKVPLEKLVELCRPYVISNSQFLISKNDDFFTKIVALKRERMNKLSEVGEDIDYFFEIPEYEKEKLMWKSEKDIANAKKHLEEVVSMLEKINEGDFVSHNIKDEVWEYAEREGKGNVLWPWRMALSGRDKSPDPIVLSEILGKKETIKRLQNAISKI